MSLSKPIPLCKFCDVERGIYMCPRCNLRYCSSRCYKDLAHERCTELFFQEWVMTTLREQAAEKEEKERMMKILREMREKDDNRQETEDLPIQERFFDLSLEGDIDEKLIWDRLNSKEKANFSKMISDKSELSKIVPVKKPWWDVKELNVICDNEAAESSSQDIGKKPPLPVDIKPLSVIAKKIPSETISFNIINVLYSYAFLMNFHNNEPQEFMEDIMESLFYLCPVLFQQMNYLSLQESVQDSIRLLSSSSFEVSSKDAKSVCFHVCSIIDGPENCHPNSYVLCAVSDIKTIILSYDAMCKADKSNYQKDVRQRVLQAVKKLDYFLSWILDYYDSQLRPISAEIQKTYISELMLDSCLEKNTESVQVVEKTDSSKSAKVLIEEL